MQGSYSKNTPLFTATEGHMKEFGLVFLCTAIFLPNTTATQSPPPQIKNMCVAEQLFCCIFQIYTEEQLLHRVFQITKVEQLFCFVTLGSGTF